MRRTWSAERKQLRTITRERARRVLIGVEVREEVPLFRRSLFAAAVAGGSWHPQREGDTNHDPGGKHSAKRLTGRCRLHPALSALGAREKLYMRRRSYGALRAIDACPVGRRRTSAGSANNGLALSCKGVKLMELGFQGCLCGIFEPDGNCLCLREDFFHAFFEASGDAKAKVPPRYATCKQQRKRDKK